MDYETASSSLAALGFECFQGNDHVVVIGTGNVTCGHEYYWCDVKTGEMVIVDLLRPLDGTTHNKTVEAFLNQWNAAQVERAGNLATQAGTARDATRRSSCVTHEEAFLSLLALGFRGFPGNDHSVDVGAGSTQFTHEYRWCDLKQVGMAVVDLLRPLDGAVNDEAQEAILRQWNAAQVKRANDLVAQAREVENVMRWCS